MANGQVHIGVDVGGTFTDAVLVHHGRLHVAKTPTTPHDQGVGVVDAVSAVLALAGRSAADVTGFVHGMTVGTNALLEGTGAPVALITTAGFADVVALRRQDRAHLYRLSAAHPSPIVPIERRFEVDERVGPDGAITPLSHPSVERAIDAVAASGVAAVAVALLFSFRDPSHERAIAARLAARLPGVHVSLSSDVVPVIREYERFATTCVDAHLAPVLGSYLSGLERRARRAGLPTPSIMQSNGGTLALEAAARNAAFTVLSGPAGGVIGAAAVAARMGIHDILTFDMGGTSCDVALVRGTPARTTGTVINGHPIHLPMLDIHTVSAGGGSIAWVDSGGALRVGPQSAGAVPGPACAGLGGTSATVTDANVVLGRIDAGRPLSAGVTLDAAAAHRAVARVADELGIAVVACARGIVAVAVEEMVRALRVVSVERGFDPREVALVAFGGAGPLHACDVADALDIRTVVLPPAAGALAALGLVLAGERRDLARTVLARVDATTDLRTEVGELGEAARATLPDGRLEWSADCRYTGQAHEITVAWDPSAPFERLAADFHAAHEQRSGACAPERPVELVTIRVAAVRQGARPVLADTPAVAPTTVAAPFALAGATGWIAEGWRAESGDAGALVMRR